MACRAGIRAGSFRDAACRRRSPIGRNAAYSTSSASGRGAPPVSEVSASTPVRGPSVPGQEPHGGPPFEENQRDRRGQIQDPEVGPLERTLLDPVRPGTHPRRIHEARTVRAETGETGLCRLERERPEQGNGGRRAEACRQGGQRGEREGERHRESPDERARGLFRRADRQGHDDGLAARWHRAERRTLEVLEPEREIPSALEPLGRDLLEAAAHCFRSRAADTGRPRRTAAPARRAGWPRARPTACRRGTAACPRASRRERLPAKDVGSRVDADAPTCSGDM
jgi:hypothetical protein